VVVVVVGFGIVTIVNVGLGIVTIVNVGLGIVTIVNVGLGIVTIVIGGLGIVNVGLGIVMLGRVISCGSAAASAVANCAADSALAMERAAPTTHPLTRMVAVTAMREVKDTGCSSRGMDVCYGDTGTTLGAGR
jgi:hypothetical protein